jgi:hypothetical protein
MIKNISIILGLFVSTTMLFSNASNTLEKKIKIQNQNVVHLAAKELSKQLPQKIDKYTQLINIKGNNQTLIYTYEINDSKKSDEEIMKKDRSRMKKAITGGICRSSKRFLESGINISYIYTSAKSKKRLFQFDVTQKDCGK